MRRVVSVWLLAALVWPASANIYWVAENQSDQLFRVDVTTRQATLVGPTGVNLGFGGLGFRGNQLYSWATVNTGTLYSVNTNTGAYTQIGPGGGPFGCDTFDIDPASGTAIAWSVDGRLFTVDLNAGTAAFRVATSPTGTGIASAFGPGGVLYHLDRDSDTLWRVDINTGQRTQIGPLGYDSNATNLGYNFADGMLYSIQILNANYPLYRINPATGAGTFVGNVTGLPNNPSQQITMGTFIPEPATVWLLALAGLAARRR